MKNISVKTPLAVYAVLCRLSVSFFAACSTATGFLITAQGNYASVLLPASAVFLLACGASALNQLQEREIDRRMARTRKRPLPAGLLSPTHALSLSSGLILSGLLLLGQSGMLAAGLGLGAVLWYNGVYTTLKRKTAFAAVPGALVGAIPPAIGWVSAGGALFDTRLLVLCVLFFLWQIPHFWLLVLRYGKEYEGAGLPSLSGLLDDRQITRITFVWLVATVVAGLALPFYGLIHSPIIYLALVPAAAWVLWYGTKLFRFDIHPTAYLVAFRHVNGYILFMMVVLASDNIMYRITQKMP